MGILLKVFEENKICLRRGSLKFVFKRDVQKHTLLKIAHTTRTLQLTITHNKT